jgi:hypothetical protein
LVHLHDQSRLVRVDRVIWMAQERKLAAARTRTPRTPTYPSVSACVIVVTGFDPATPFDGRYS